MLQQGSPSWPGQPAWPSGAGIIARVDELTLRAVVIQFDGRVVEVFGRPGGVGNRQHVAVMKEPEIHPPNRGGRSLVTIGDTSFGVDNDELGLRGREGSSQRV